MSRVSAAPVSPAVCSWSLQPDSPVDLAAKLRPTGLCRVQLALDPLRESPAVWCETEKVLRENGIAIISGMFGCVGEDYSTLDSIRHTGGVAPDATWEQNLRNIRKTADLAAQLELNLVTFHAGFLPHEESGPGFEKMRQRLETIAAIFASRNILVALETGQETAPALAKFLGCLENTGVNFDPANMILYGRGDPVDAVRMLGPWIRQVHLKDALRAETPGTWGREVPVGRGHVDWPEFFSALRDTGFSGSFVIERESGTGRIADIQTARAVFEKFSR